MDVPKAVATIEAECGQSSQSPPATAPTSALDPIQTLYDTPHMLGPTARTITDYMTPNYNHAMARPARTTARSHKTTTPPSLEFPSIREKQTRAVRKTKSEPTISAATGRDTLRKSNKGPHHPHGRKTVALRVPSTKRTSNPRQRERQQIPYISMERKNSQKMMKTS